MGLNCSLSVILRWLSSTLQMLHHLQTRSTLAKLSKYPPMLCAPRLFAVTNESVPCTSLCKLMPSLFHVIKSFISGSISFQSHIHTCQVSLFWRDIPDFSKRKNSFYHFAQSHCIAIYRKIGNVPLFRQNVLICSFFLGLKVGRYIVLICKV